jgi:hypothetical protein
MVEGTLGSSITLAAATLLTWALVHLAFLRVGSRAAALGLFLAFILLGAAAVIYVDTNVPLAASHFRPDGAQAPVWVALLAWSARVACIVGLIYFARWSAARSARAQAR